MNKSFVASAAVILAALTGCAPMCQSPWDYCNAVINPSGKPNCNFNARYNSMFTPMNGTPPTTPVEPTPAVEAARESASEGPHEYDAGAGDISPGDYNELYRSFE